MLLKNGFLSVTSLTRNSRCRGFHALGAVQKFYWFLQNALFKLFYFDLLSKDFKQAQQCMKVSKSVSSAATHIQVQPGILWINTEEKLAFKFIRRFVPEDAHKASMLRYFSFAVSRPCTFKLHRAEVFQPQHSTVFWTCINNCMYMITHKLQINICTVNLIWSITDH